MLCQVKDSLTNEIVHREGTVSEINDWLHEFEEDGNWVTFGPNCVPMFAPFVKEGSETVQFTIIPKPIPHMKNLFNCCLPFVKVAKYERDMKLLDQLREPILENPDIDTSESSDCEIEDWDKLAAEAFEYESKEEPEEKDSSCNFYFWSFVGLFVAVQVGRFYYTEDPR